jgi:anti-sigma factor RsiW
MHGKFTLLMSLVLDREATAAEDRLMREHLATCVPCALTWDRWRTLDRRLARAPMVAPPPTLIEGVRIRLAERRARSSRQKWIGSGLVLAWGILFCGFWLAMAGLIWWGMRHQLEMSVVVSTAARCVSAGSWLLRSLGTLAGSVGSSTLALGFGLGIGLTCSLGMLWVWVMARSRTWLRVSVPAA